MKDPQGLYIICRIVYTLGVIPATHLTVETTVSIYDRKNVNFDKTLTQGELGEGMISKHFSSKGYTVSKVDHKHYPYDLVASKNDCSYNIEVKTHRGSSKSGHSYRTFFAEVVQNTDINSIPEYLTTDDIDYVIHVSLHNNVAYMYDHKAYKQYVLGRAHLAKEAKYATSSGITIPWECKAAGFISKRTLTIRDN